MILSVYQNIQLGYVSIDILLIMIIKRIIFLSLVIFVTFAQADIYSQYYKECRKIAEAMTLNQKVGQMIQADFEIITNSEREQTNPEEAIKLQLGSLLISGNAVPTQNGNLGKIPSLAEYEKYLQAFMKANATNWKKLTDRFANLGVTVTTKDSGKYKIKLLLGTDAVHGDQHTIGTVLFPHNIGVSCSKNEANFENSGFWTRQGVKKSGFNFVFSPTVAVSHNPQWGRYYESMGQNEALIQKFAQSYIRGIQDVRNGKLNGALASAKHFFGDGSTLYGCNEGNSNVLSFKNFINHNIKGYVGGVKSNVGNVMISYSAINWIPHSINSHYILNLLREDVGFRGFTITDYNDLQNINTRLLPRTFMNFTDQQEAYSTMVNAGVDMFMISKKAVVERLFKHTEKATKKNFIPEVRLTDAVTRILTVKMAMGLIEKVQLDEHNNQIYKPVVKVQPSIEYPLTSSGNEYIDSLNAVQQSLVLLKNNNNIIPTKSIMSAIKYIIMIGQKIHNINRLTKTQLFRNFDNIGMQCGGWSVRWQGFQGNDFWTGQNKVNTNASSILDALKDVQKSGASFELIYANYTNINNEVIIDQERTKFINDLKVKRKDMNARNTLIIGTFGEFPYAESVGDVNIPYCKIDDSPGCLYNPLINPYSPSIQSRSLKVQLSKYDSEVLSTIREQDKNIPLISVLLSGRPLLIDDLLASSDTVLAAWLPGTSGGQGIVNAIVGKYIIKPKDSPLKNTLSFDWPKDMNSLQNFPIYSADGTIPRINSPAFQYGYGLSTDTKALQQ